MIEFDTDGFDKWIEGNIQKYQFQVGILEDKPYRLAKFPTQWTQYAGMILRKAGFEKSGITLGEIARQLNNFYEWLTRPFNLASNKDIIKVVSFVVDNLNGKANDRRILNAIQGIIRNPILRGEYGSNSRKRVKQKGFDRPMVDTGQLFKNIKARWIK